MLAQFQIKRHFNRLAISLWVDRDRKKANLLATYDRRILRMGDVEFWKVSTPNDAEAWLSEPQGELGNRIETLEHLARTGIAA